MKTQDSNSKIEGSGGNESYYTCSSLSPTNVVTWEIRIIAYIYKFRLKIETLNFKYSLLTNQPFVF